MATFPRDAMQQAAQMRQPAPAPQQQDVGGQVTGLLDQVRQITLQPQNFTQAAPIVTAWTRDWMIQMIQLAKSKGASGGPTQPGQAPTTPQPAPSPTGTPPQATPTPVAGLAR